MSSVTETIFPKAEDPALVRERKKTEAAQNAAAVSKALKASIYYDGEKYWSKLPTARWAPDNQQLMASNLRNEYGISKGRDMDNVLFQIRKYRRVVGTFPYIHNGSEIIRNPQGPRSTRRTVSCSNRRPKTALSRGSKSSSTRFGTRLTLSKRTYSLLGSTASTVPLTKAS